VLFCIIGVKASFYTHLQLLRLFPLVWVHEHLEDIKLELRVQSVQDCSLGEYHCVREPSSRELLFNSGADPEKKFWFLNSIWASDTKESLQRVEYYRSL